MVVEVHRYVIGERENIVVSGKGVFCYDRNDWEKCSFQEAKTKEQALDIMTEEGLSVGYLDKATLSDFDYSDARQASFNWTYVLKAKERVQEGKCTEEQLEEITNGFIEPLERLVININKQKNKPANNGMD